MLTRPPMPEFELPDEGVYGATITEIKDLGQVNSKFGMQHQIAFILTLDRVNSKGKPYELRARFNLVGGPKANLTKALVGILGSDPGGNFDLESLEGTTCNIFVKHSEPNVDGRVFANIESFFQPKKQKASTDRVDRVVNAVRQRQQEEGSTMTATATATATEDDDPDQGIPF